MLFGRLPSLAVNSYRICELIFCWAGVRDSFSESAGRWMFMGDGESVQENALTGRRVSTHESDRAREQLMCISRAGPPLANGGRHNGDMTRLVPEDCFDEGGTMGTLGRAQPSRKAA